jgi:hypothetical protein
MRKPKAETQPLDHLPTTWFESSRQEDKDTVKADLARARDGFRHLARILKERDPKTRFADYDTPAWQYRLAHVQGQREELDFVLKLIDPIVRYNLNDR